MSNNNIKNTILSQFRQKEIMKDIAEDQDFYELGVSSLSIVELQILVEKALNLEIETSKLMAAPTIAQWVQIYSSADAEQGEPATDMA